MDFLARNIPAICLQEGLPRESLPHGSLIAVPGEHTLFQSQDNDLQTRFHDAYSTPHLISFIGSIDPYSCPWASTARAITALKASRTSGYLVTIALMTARLSWNARPVLEASAVS